MKHLFIGIGLAILLLVPAVAPAQILVAGEGPVVYGHHHLNTTNMLSRMTVSAESSKVFAKAIDSSPVTQIAT